MKRSTIWAVVVLVGGYITLQLVADVTAVKVCQLGVVTLPAGTLVYALTFTWRDMVHKRLSKEWARAAIVTAAGCNIFMALYFLGAAALPPAPFWPNQNAFVAVLCVVPRIAIASILAEVISELVDTEVYHFLIPRIPEGLQVGRVLGSNMISLPLDSVLFVSMAFGGTMPFLALIKVIFGQIVYKTVVTCLSLPLIYTVKPRPIGVELA